MRFFLVALLGFSFLSYGGSSKKSLSQGKIPNQFIVVFDQKDFRPFDKTPRFRNLKNKGVRIKALDRYQSQMRKNIEGQLKERKWGRAAIKSVFAGKRVGMIVKTSLQNINRLKKLYPKIIIIQDVSEFIQLGEIESSSNSASSNQVIGWGIEAVGAGNTYGGGKFAFVMDTGIDLDHADLAVNVNLSRSFVDGEPSPGDGNGHGTSVAGIIGAKHNSIGTKGVAAGAMVVSVKMISADDNITWSSVVQGLDYVSIAADPGDVVNMSYKIDPVPLAENLLDNYIHGLGQGGIYVTIAAGNDAEDCAGTYPARVVGSNIYTVSAMNEDRELADFSNYDLPIRYAAPGVMVRVLSRFGDWASYGNGTSLAAPFVAGILLVNDGLLNYDGFLQYDRDSYPDRCASIN